MMFVAVHLPPAYSMPAAVGLGLLVIWYWRRLGEASVPVSRRWIRRCSLVVILMLLPLLVGAVSYVNPNVNKHGYLVIWSIIILLLLLIVISALIDAGNNLRLHQEDKRRQIIDQAIESACQRRGADEPEDESR